jgi:hypothetical protein
MRATRVGIGAVLVLLVVAGATAGARGERVFGIEDCGDPEVRPDRIVLACADFGLYVNKLDWKSWGGAKARATGVIHANTCDPSCAEGSYQSYPVNVRLFKVRNRPCGDGGQLIRMYTRIKLSFPDGEPENVDRFRESRVYGGL